MFLWQDENIYFKLFTNVAKRWSCLAVTFTPPPCLLLPVPTGYDFTLCEAVKDLSAWTKGPS